MWIVDNRMTIEELGERSNGYFDDMVKGVVDVEKGVLAVDAELHSDIEGFLLEQGSEQSNIWGINLLLDEDDAEDVIEFDSLINIRPKQDNRSRYVEDEEIRKRICEVVGQWIEM